MGVSGKAAASPQCNVAKPPNASEDGRNLMKSIKFNILQLSWRFRCVSAQAPRLVDQTEQNLRKHVEYLASDKLEGRRTGERGRRTRPDTSRIRSRITN